MEFSELLRRNRAEKGLTVRELEKKIAQEQGVKISKTLINFLEKGKRQPTYEVAYALSKALDIDIEESLGIVYRSRCNQNEAREATLLRDLLEKQELKGVSAVRIVGRKSGKK